MNSYALVCPATAASVLVDPGAEPSRLIAMLEGTKPLAILVTHSHRDHVAALREMRALLDVPVAAHDGPRSHGSVIDPDLLLADGDAITIGNHRISTRAALGHTRDQVCFNAGGDRYLGGDAIFEQGPPLTRSDDDFAVMLQTLHDVILDWPSGSICYPGHGEPFSLDRIRNRVRDFIEGNRKRSSDGHWVWPSE